MERFKSLITLMVIFFLTFSCSKGEGDWSDIIKLSTKTVEFSSSANTITITTEGDWWWISLVSVNDNDFYNFEDIDLTSDNYLIIRDCVIIEKTDNYTFSISVDENSLDIERIIRIGVTAGDYNDNVVITQAAR